MRETGVEACGRPYRAFAADSFFDALLGVHAVPEDVEALVIVGSSVHGLTLRESIWVAGVDERGVGLGLRLLRPRRAVRFVGARAVIEFPLGIVCEGEHRSHTIRWAG